jgi:DNA anti-recombination protein RmuC
MITNERQYRITRSWQNRFEQARASADQRAADLHPRALQALRDQYESQIDELRADLVDDEATRYAKVGIERLQAVADALGVKIREHVILPVRGDA